MTKHQQLAPLEDYAEAGALTPAAVEAALNPQQRRFVQEYLIDLNGAAAYLRAGYAVSSMEAAAVNASRLLTNPNVAIAVGHRQAQIDRHLGLSAERLERQSARIAFGDIRNVVSIAADGSMTLRPSDEWTDAAAAAVASVTQVEFKGKVTTTIRMHNPAPAREELYKRMNLYREHQSAGVEAQAVANYSLLLAAQRQLAAEARGAPPALPSARILDIAATAKQAPPDAAAER